MSPGYPLLRWGGPSPSALFPAMSRAWRPWTAFSPGCFWPRTGVRTMAAGRSTAGSCSALVPWREVAGFTAMAYVIAWTVWAPLWPTALQSMMVGRTPSAYGGGPLAPVGMFAPALAALLMRLLVSREGVHGSLGPLRRWRWSVLAVLVPIVIVAATIAVATTTGLAMFHLGGTQPTWEVLILLLLVGTRSAPCSRSARSTGGAATCCHGCCRSAKSVPPSWSR